MERHLRLLSPCMTAIPPITPPAAPTLFQSTFTFPPTGGQPAARPGPRPCRLLQVASMSPEERDHIGHGGDDFGLRTGCRARSRRGPYLDAFCPGRAALPAAGNAARGAASRAP